MAYADGAGAGGMVDVMQAERDAAGEAPVRLAGSRRTVRQPSGQRDRRSAG
jgi:hypothetical protein